LNAAIRHADTPMPISARPIHRPASELLDANSAAPSAATSSSAASMRREPYLSSQMPSGSCMQPKLAR
jgi:hypothetical protein